MNSNKERNPKFKGRVIRHANNGDFKAGSNPLEIEVDDQLTGGATTAESPSGSGYKDLEGTVINYEYVGFGGFYLQIKDNRIKWQGFKGAFKNITSEVIPQISKVADNIYLLSWGVAADNGDNVVMNFNELKVFGHLMQSGSIDLIHGTIHRYNTPETIAPKGRSASTVRLAATLLFNALKSGKSVSNLIGGEVGEVNFEGKKLLEDKILVYETPEGLIEIDFSNAKQRSETTGSESQEREFSASVITNGIYLISWAGIRGGNHIVFNTHNRKIYKQIADDGSRVESIYTVRFFGIANS